MKIAILSPHFPPKVSGLSHYSDNFARELVKAGHSIEVITTSKSENKSMLKISPDIDNTGFLTFFKIYKNLKSSTNEELLIQYVPYMYGRLGINFFLPFFVFMIRYFSKLNVSTMFHEINYPLEGNLKSVILYISHKIMAFFLLMFSQKIFASTTRMTKILSFINLSRKKIHLLQVGSNIARETYSQTQKKETLDRYSIPKEKIKIILFGGFHPSKKMDLIINSLLYLNLDQKNMIIIHIGVSKKQADDFIGQELPSNIYIATGKIPDRDVSILLQESNILITYFSDGVSTRRGSLIAGITHGLSCFSTTDASTDNLFFNKQQIELAPTDEKLYFEHLSDFIENYQPQDYSSDSLNSFFSWEEIIKKYLNIIMH